MDSERERNSEIHAIGLHGPWSARVIANLDQDSSTDIAQDFRVKFPLRWANWPTPDFRGRVEFRRNFNRPTGLLPDQSVWIVIEHDGLCGRVYLNDEQIGALVAQPEHQCQLRVDVFKSLKRSNLLRIEVDMLGREVGDVIVTVGIEIEQ